MQCIPANLALCNRMRITNIYKCIRKWDGKRVKSVPKNRYFRVAPNFKSIQLNAIDEKQAIPNNMLIIS